MVAEEVLDETRVHNVTGGNPGPLLGAASLPVHQVLATTTMSTKSQKPLLRINRATIDEPRG